MSGHVTNVQDTEGRAVYHCGVMTQIVYQPAGFSGIELRSVTDSPDYEPHLHEAYTIGMLMHGGQTIRAGREVETVFVGSMQFFEPYQVHENRRLPGNKYSFRHIEIPRSRLLQLLGGRVPPARTYSINDAGLFQAFNRAFDALARNDEPLAQDDLLTGALMKLLYATEQSQAIPDIAPGLVARAREFLHANYQHPVTLNALAELTQVSRVHVSRLFKRHVGLAPHEYLVQLRVVSAKAKLAAGVPVAEAALSSGFADQSHLTRHFKRITHLTPAAYARSCYERSRP